jgi:threonyl-tRNA synthetase
MLVIGDREVEANGVRPRQRSGEQLELMSAEGFAALVEQECLQETGGRIGIGIV